MTVTTKTYKKVVIVMPVYNGEASLPLSIDSIKKQTYKNWQVVIVNDGSTDGTRKILDSIDDRRFKIIHLPQNRGRAYARQVALEHLKQTDADYMCMLDADDWYYPNKLELQVALMEKHTELSLLSTSLGIVDSSNKLIGKIQPLQHFETLKGSLSNFKKIPHGSAIIRIGDLGNITYDTDLKFAEDQDFLRRLLDGKNYGFLPEITYIYTMENSFSLKKYRNSIRVSNKLYGKYHKSILGDILNRIRNEIKYSIVFVLYKLGRITVYFNKITETPTSEELIEFEKRKDS